MPEYSQLPEDEQDSYSYRSEDIFSSPYFSFDDYSGAPYSTYFPHHPPSEDIFSYPYFSFDDDYSGAPYSTYFPNHPPSEGFCTNYKHNIWVDHQGHTCATTNCKFGVGVNGVPASVACCRCGGGAGHSIDEISYSYKHPVNEQMSYFSIGDWPSTYSTSMPFEYWTGFSLPFYDENASHSFADLRSYFSFNEWSSSDETFNPQHQNSDNSHTFFDERTGYSFPDLRSYFSFNEWSTSYETSNPQQQHSGYSHPFNDVRTWYSFPDLRSYFSVNDWSSSYETFNPQQPNSGHSFSLYGEDNCYYSFNENLLDWDHMSYFSFSDLGPLSYATFKPQGYSTGSYAFDGNWGTSYA